MRPRAGSPLRSIRAIPGIPGPAGLCLSVPVGADARQAATASTRPPRGFLDLHRPPDSVAVQTETGEHRLVPASDHRWRADGIVFRPRDYAEGTNRFRHARLAGVGHHAWRPSGLLAMPSMTIWTAVLAAGLALYIAGLFAPVGGKPRL